MIDWPEACERAAKRIEAVGDIAQGAFARDAGGRPCEPCDPLAIRWCGMGALFCELGAETSDVERFTISKRLHAWAADNDYDEGFGYWNDRVDRTVEEVATALREIGARGLE